MVLTSRNAGPASVSALHPLTVAVYPPGALSPARWYVTSTVALDPVKVTRAGALAQLASDRRVYTARVLESERTSW
jgi:hypothetical protein